MLVNKADDETFRITHGKMRKEIFVGQVIKEFKSYNEYILFTNNDSVLFLSYNDTVSRLAVDVGVFDIGERRLCYQTKNYLVFLEFEAPTKLIYKIPIFIPFSEPLLCVDATFGYFCLRRENTFICFFGDCYKYAEAFGDFQAYGFMYGCFWAQRSDKTELYIKKCE